MDDAWKRFILTFISNLQINFLSTQLFDGSINIYQLFDGSINICEVLTHLKLIHLLFFQLKFQHSSSTQLSLAQHFYNMAYSKVAQNFIFLFVTCMVALAIHESKVSATQAQFPPPPFDDTVINSQCNARNGEHVNLGGTLDRIISRMNYFVFVSFTTTSTVAEGRKRPLYVQGGCRNVLSQINCQACLTQLKSKALQDCPFGVASLAQYTDCFFRWDIENFVSENPSDTG